MIIEFSQTADYWRNECVTARREGRLADALVAARRALQKEDNYDNRMEYADLLADLHLPRWSASLCLHGESGDTEEEFSDWLELMADNSARGESVSSAIFYHMKLLALHHGGENPEEWGDALMQYMSDLAEEDKEPPAEPLQYAEDAHNRHNRQLYERMYEAFDGEDYPAVCRMWPDVHPDYDYYKEMLFMAGISRAKLGDKESARRLMWRMFEVSEHDARVLYYIDELAGGMTDEEMDKSLQVVPDDDNAFNQSMAGVCAALHGLYDKAVAFGVNAMRLCPAEPQYIMRLAAVYARKGEEDKALALQRQVVNLYGDFLPDALADWRMPADVDVHFPLLPRQFYTYLWDMLTPVMGTEAFVQRMQLDGAFRAVVRFLLTDTDQDVLKKNALAKDVGAWQTRDGIAFWRDVLAEPVLHGMVQFQLVYALLQTVRRGKVRLTCGYVSDDFQLRVPPSFDDFGGQMRRIYAHAYCFMVNMNKHNELRLSRLAERLYLYLSEDEYYQANLMAYALLYAGHIVDKDMLDEVIEQQEWDAELIMRYIDVARQALKNK